MNKKELNDNIEKITELLNSSDYESGFKILKNFKNQELNDILEDKIYSCINNEYFELDDEEELQKGLKALHELIPNIKSIKINYLDSVDEMKNTIVSENRANHLLMESAHTGLVSYSHLKDVHKEWKQPSYSDFIPRTEWSLYNCFNEVMKKYNPIRQQTSVGGLVELFSNN